jgi:hypothetical protein
MQLEILETHQYLFEGGGKTRILCFDGLPHDLARIYAEVYRAVHQAKVQMP